MLGAARATASISQFLPPRRPHRQPQIQSSNHRSSRNGWPSALFRADPGHAMPLLRTVAGDLCSLGADWRICGVASPAARENGLATITVRPVAVFRANADVHLKSHRPATRAASRRGLPTQRAERQPAFAAPQRQIPSALTSLAALRAIFCTSLSHARGSFWRSASRRGARPPRKGPIRSSESSQGESAAWPAHRRPNFPDGPLRALIWRRITNQRHAAHRSQAPAISRAVGRGAAGRSGSGEASSSTVARTSSPPCKRLSKLSAPNLRPRSPTLDTS